MIYFFIYFFILPSLALSQTTNNSRIENEYILDVPEEITIPLWEYIKSLSNPKELRNIGKNLTTNISQENFRDIYFDSPDFILLKNNTGIRHRTRFTPDDPAGKKNGRQLIQMKQKYEDASGTSREEIKYDASLPAKVKDYWDQHPLLQFIHPKERPHFFEQLRKQGIVAPELMKPIFTIEQLRQRIYIQKNGIAHITITLDHSKSTLFKKTIQFYSMDIELNEIAYTNATKGERSLMQNTNDLLWKKIRGKFSQLTPDQSPKYNKTFSLFATQIPDLEMRIFYPWKWRLLHLW